MATISGGKKLESALVKMALKVSRPGTLQVGFMENATYPDGKKVAMIAAIQEFGAPRAGIPPRPFFRNMIRKYSKDWPKGFKGLLIKHKYDANDALEEAGHLIAQQLQQSIRDTNTPPLKPATIARKGFSKPLIETSHMINSVTSRIKR